MTKSKSPFPSTAVTAKEVAELAGVSRAAVSRTFTPGASVSAQTRKKVNTAADKLGYQVNHLARGLISAQSGLVAIIAAEVETPYRAALLSSLLQALQADGKTPILIATDRSDESVKVALRQAISYRTEAAIILSGMPDTALADMCQRNGMRLVLINRKELLPGALQIRLDDEDAGATAFNALQMTGCKRIALIASGAGTPSLEARIIGFRNAAKQAEIETEEFISGATSYENGLQMGTDIFTQIQHPDGVFCVTDLLACGVMDAIRVRLGKSIPEDVAVIGFDNISQTSWANYRLTTFAQPIDEIASAAVGWLGKPTDESSQGASMALKAHLIWRDTVRPEKRGT